MSNKMENDSNRETNPKLISGIALILLQYIFITILKFDPPVRNLKYVGFILWLAGLILWSLSALTLYKYKITAKADYMNTFKLVRSGIYSIIRHPQYLGFILFSAGFIFITQNLYIIIVSISACVILYLGIKAEDKQLLQKYSNDYREYIRTTPAINFFAGLINKLFF